MKQILFILTCMITSWSYATVQDSIGVVTQNETQFVQYLVTPGETVYRLSTTHNITITQLMTDNPGLENGLKVGQIILLRTFVRTEPVKLPAIAQSPFNVTMDGPKEHVVQKGETYYGLSKKYGIPLNTLLEWNGSGLKEGQVLTIKNPAIVETEQPKEESPITMTESVEEETPKKEPLPLVETPIEKEVVKEEVIKKEVLKEETPVVDTKPIIKETPTKPIPKVVTIEKPIKSSPNTTVTKTAPPKVKKATPSVTELLNPEDIYEYDSTRQQVLIVPFDPHLYWSDADAEIMQGSKLKTQLEVRKIIRRRLNALLDPRGFENIHLVGGRFKDTLTDLNKIYSSVSYDYQDAVLSEEYKKTLEKQEEENKKKGQVSTTTKLKNKFGSLKDKLSNQTTEEEAKVDPRADKYFGVIIKDPKFFEYFEHKYSVDYYIFINQFEVITDYDHCLDRTTQNYRRYFIVHFSIFDSNGKQIAGNKYKKFYPSNSNNINQITGDNLQEMADRILMELPLPR